MRFIYNPFQRKPSNKKKKRKLKRKAQAKRRRDTLRRLKEEQDPKIQRLTLLSLPYPIKLQRVIASVDTWYDNLSLDFAFREVLLQNSGWFPIRFAATRLVEWTNHGILINSFVQVPDRYDINCLYSIDGETSLPPLPASFAVDATEWCDYEYDEEDFQEDEWFDLQTELDPILQKLQLVDDSNDYDALFHRYDYPLERIQQIDAEANQQSNEVLRQYPRHFGSDEERHPTFGYDFSTTMPTTTTAATTPSLRPTTDVFAELQRILSKRKQ
jgi:hypothetical protein